MPCSGIFLKIRGGRKDDLGSNEICPFIAVSVDGRLSTQPGTRGNVSRQQTVLEIQSRPEGFKEKKDSSEQWTTMDGGRARVCLGWTLCPLSRFPANLSL